MSAGSQEKGAIGAMFEREMKQEKNLEVSARKCPMFSCWNHEMCACFDTQSETVGRVPQ